MEAIFSDCGGDYLTEIHRIDLRTDRDDLLLQADLMFVRCLAVTPNQHIVALSGWERTESELVPSVRRLDAFRGTLLDPIPTFALCSAFSLDGQLLAVGSMVQEEYRAGGPLSGVRIWSGRQLVGEFAPTARVMAWAPDGRLFWAVWGQLNVGVPGVRDSLRSWEDKSGSVSAIAVSHDGRFLLTGADNGMCALHDPVGGEMRAAFDWGIGPIHSVAFSPDGLTCAAGGENGQVVVWDVDA
jgi:WD40 repeat protein